LIYRALGLAASAAALTVATATRADDLWRSQLEVGSFDVLHQQKSESFDLQLRPGWRLWDFGVFAGGMYTTKNAYMGYAGVTYDLRVTDNILILPDAAVGFYQHGDDKNLGNTAEFRTGLGVAYPGVEIAALTLAVPLFGKPTATSEAPPAPPPAVMAAPGKSAAASNYLVFFDFNKSDLSAEAVRIVKTAASGASTAGTTRITVTGHTDTVGSDAYNLRLSKRRAESVETELVHDGVPAGEIAIYAKGKRDLLIPTADGVREPQNRRVQIVLE
jgi:outer membrane protein OmpA-like peptidoglycan-associated protein